MSNGTLQQGGLNFGHLKPPCGQFQPGQTQRFFCWRDARNEIAFSRVQQLVVCQRPRRDDTCDFPSNQSLGGFGVFNLVADRSSETVLNQKGLVSKLPVIFTSQIKNILYKRNICKYHIKDEVSEEIEILHWQSSLEDFFFLVQSCYLFWLNLNFEKI